MDVKTLSAMLGHVSAATTLDIYTHITDDMRRGGGGVCTAAKSRHHQSRIFIIAARY